MFDEIPIMDNLGVKEQYAEYLQSKFGDESQWEVSPAAIGNNVIISSKKGLLFQENSLGKIKGVYIYREVSYSGIILVGNYDLEETKFYGKLKNRGYEKIEEILNMGMIKPFSKTEDIVTELRALEKLVFN